MLCLATKLTPPSKGSVTSDCPDLKARVATYVSIHIHADTVVHQATLQAAANSEPLSRVALF